MHTRITRKASSVTEESSALAPPARIQKASPQAKPAKDTARPAQSAAPGFSFANIAVTAEQAMQRKEEAAREQDHRDATEQNVTGEKTSKGQSSLRLSARGVLQQVGGAAAPPSGRPGGDDLTLPRQVGHNFANVSIYPPALVQRKPNQTGLPDQLKAGVESLSGLSLDDVKVHRNSSKPKEVEAHAYAQGSDIHLGPGQEEHLPHEAWHVVQQKQGRVQTTIQAKGVAINDDQGLEREADVMGQQALSHQGSAHHHGSPRSEVPFAEHQSHQQATQILQGRFVGDFGGTLGNLNQSLLGLPAPTLFKLLQELKDSPTELKIENGGRCLYKNSEKTLLIPGQNLVSLSNPRTEAALKISFASDLTHELSHAHDAIIGNKGIEWGTREQLHGVLDTELRAWANEAINACEGAKNIGGLVGLEAKERDLINGWKKVVASDINAKTLYQYAGTNEVLRRLSQYVSRYLKPDKGTPNSDDVEKWLDRRGNGGSKEREWLENFLEEQKGRVNLAYFVNIEKDESNRSIWDIGEDEPTTQEQQTDQPTSTKRKFEGQSTDSNKEQKT